MDDARLQFRAIAAGAGIDPVTASPGQDRNRPPSCHAVKFQAKVIASAAAQAPRQA